MDLHAAFPTPEGLVERNGLLVHTGQPTSAVVWERLAEDFELQRMQEILGQSHGQ
jgi:hypothetical protein